MMSENPQFPDKIGAFRPRQRTARAGTRVLMALQLGLFAVSLQSVVTVASAESTAVAAASQFGASDDLHTQVTEGFINTSTPEVWRIFTTAEGYKLTGVTQAEVELKIGGLIRTHYSPRGRLGDDETIVNEILAYEPERMLAIRIKQAPASFQYQDAVASTWTVIYMNPAGDHMTQVRIVGLGYTDQPQSQAMRKFFAEGNRWTLDHIAKPYWPKCPKCVAEEAAAATR